MVELTNQQLEALESGPIPARLLDPRTRHEYVLVSAETYERIRHLLNPGTLSDQERQVVLSGVWQRANWDDPRMDDYDALESSGKP